MDTKALKQALAASSNATDEEKEAILKKLKEMAVSPQPYDKEKFLSSLSPHMRVRVEALHDLQDKVDELMKQYAKERKQLELKYRALCEPHYEERSKIVSGEVVPPGGEAEEVGVSKFWLNCLANNDEIGETITEKDSKVLEHLIDITCTHYDGDETVDGEEGEATSKHGFTLTFKFSPNPYFSHTELTKTYLFQDEEQTVLMKAVGTDIEWKQGKDPTVKVMKKKGKGGAAAKFKTEKVESFFHFFNPPTIPEEGDPDMDPEEEEELQEAVEDDYETGATIKEKILPIALKWYTGEAEAEQGMIMLDDDDDDEDGDDDGDEDEDGDEDDSAPVAPPTDKKDPECKQQ